MTPILYIVIPCYNEEKVLPVTAPLFLEQLNKMIQEEKIKKKSKILFVNDGSNDKTWVFICELAKQDSHFVGISQSKNRGQQKAIYAGLMEAKELGCDIAISIDCDGQDDISKMECMIDEYIGGCDVVYGVRNSRKTDSFFKRQSANWFYRMMNAFGVELVYNHADYRLLSSRVLEALSEYKEVNLFLRGMIPLVGFKSTSVMYERQKRMEGKTHYSLVQMIRLALDGITSFSVKPLRLIAGLGIGISFISLLGIIWAVVRYMTHNTVIGWASTTVIICFIGGIQLISLGVLGEYIGKIYLEVKNRPRYIISERTNGEKEK